MRAADATHTVIWQAWATRRRKARAIPQLISPTRRNRERGELVTAHQSYAVQFSTLTGKVGLECPQDRALSARYSKHIIVSS